MDEVEANEVMGGVVVGMSSLYVGDLDPNVSDSQLFDLFNQVGPVVSVRVCRDSTTKRSLGYGYVNFAGPQDAGRAIGTLNFTPLNNKPIRVMYSHRDPTIRKSGAGNIFIKNLDKAIDNKALYETFSSFGNISSCKIATNGSGQSKGYGFVQYDNEESAKNAIEKLNGMLLNDKQVYVGPFLRRQERENTIDNTKFTNVYVKNLAESTTDEDLNWIFSKYGKTTSAVVMCDLDGKSKCFGFVNFENPDDAVKAVQSLNGYKFDEKEWYVGKAQKKAEREAELRHRFEQNLKDTVDKHYQGRNLYIKNLDDSVDDDKLKELFSQFGTITSCKVMRDPTGVSKGMGFVAFSSAEEASRALLTMKGKIIVSKPLYVALAQRKADRRARLQARFSQTVAFPTSVGPRMPLYSHGDPGLGQQIYYGQAPPAIISPQPGFGYEQQLMPGITGGAPLPSFFVPMVHQPPHPAGRRPGSTPGQQPHQPFSMMHQQMLSRGRHRYPGFPNAVMLGAQNDMDGIHMHEASRSPAVPVGALATQLANATPDQQTILLGENLYPQVEQLEPEMASKVTGMLLEMDQTEVLHLLESPDALKAKVFEAMDILRNVANNPADELAD